MASSINWLNQVLEALRREAPDHHAKVQRLLPIGDPHYQYEAKHFFSRWFTRQGAWPVAQSIRAYTGLLAEMHRLQADYVRTGRYPHTSFREVEAAFYADPSRMRTHLEALALAQFLWIDQWQRFTFFSEWIQEQAGRTHLEIGPGHGLYLEKTVRAAEGSRRITALDVSAESLATARAIAGNTVSFLTADFLQWEPSCTFASITMGEVLEHAGEPEAFLAAARRCLAPGGSLFLSTPLHAPMPDHITAFPDLQDLRHRLSRAGFRIVREHACAVDGIALELAQRFLKPIMYCAALETPSS